MLTVIVGALFTLVGVVLGGGVRTWETKKAREAEAAALLSALVAEVEAVTRLANHRQFIPGLLAMRDEARIQMQLGRGDQPARFMVIKLKYDYFAVFNASLGKLGILHPYHADRIVRFYTYAKAAIENYDPASPFQEGVDAAAADEIFTNDLLLLNTMMMLGNHIATFRPIDEPRGVANPFGVDDRIYAEPALPIDQPAQSNITAAATTSPPA